MTNKTNTVQIHRSLTFCFSPEPKKNVSMNTASRMESTGDADMIQLSQSTADLLRASGKGHWLHPREDKGGLADLLVLA